MYISNGKETFKITKYAEKLFDIKVNNDCDGCCDECPLDHVKTDRCDHFGWCGKSLLKDWTIHGSLSHHKIGKFYE